MYIPIALYRLSSLYLGIYTRTCYVHTQSIIISEKGVINLESRERNVESLKGGKVKEKCCN